MKKDDSYKGKPCTKDHMKPVKKVQGKPITAVKQAVKAKEENSDEEGEIIDPIMIRKKKALEK